MKTPEDRAREVLGGVFTKMADAIRESDQNGKSYSPIVVAIALSLYGYNVSAGERANRLYQHFNGECMDEVEMIDLFQGRRAAYVATELPYPTALVYVQHAMDRYGKEAQHRAEVEVKGL